MEFEVIGTQLSPERAVLAVAGRLNAVTAPQLKERLKQDIESGHREIIVDLGRTSFMDSSGLAVLVSGLKSTRERGGWLKLAGANEQIATIFHITLLDRVFEFYPSVEAAGS